MNKNQFWQYLVGSISITLLIPNIANAHTGVEHAFGFWHGIQHPIGGLDHILAMVAVGLWARRTDRGERLFSYWNHECTRSASDFTC